MNYNLVKTGGCSIVIGPGHYGNFISIYSNKLIKLTRIIQNHNEFKHLNKIRRIEEYSKYYSIPDKDVFILTPDNEFYQYAKRLASIDKLNIFNGSINYVYLDYAGDTDVLDSISYMMINNSLGFWKSYKLIEKLAHHILKGLSFLHERNIAHLDIKSENIMINTKNCTFKIIDFGFCSCQPFDDFVENPRGTPGYFPKYHHLDKIEPWLPKVNANDFVKDSNGRFPSIYDRALVYKIDSYCFGRVLYFLKYIYDEIKTYYCYNWEHRLGERLNSIIASLTEDNVYKRINIKECLYLYF